MQDVVAAIRGLPLGSATARAELGDRIDWNHLAANVATLVDLMSYTVHAEYVQWTTDPDDPQVKADRERRKKQGIKPPPVPIVPPVAFRPESVATEVNAAYDELVARFAGRGLEQPREARVAVAGKRWVTDTNAIDRLLESL